MKPHFSLSKFIRNTLTSLVMTNFKQHPDSVKSPKSIYHTNDIPQSGKDGSCTRKFFAALRRCTPKKQACTPNTNIRNWAISSCTRCPHPTPYPHSGLEIATLTNAFSNDLQMVANLHLKLHLNYQLWLEKILKFICLKWLKLHLNYQPWLEKILKFTSHKWLKLHTVSLIRSSDAPEAQRDYWVHPIYTASVELAAGRLVCAPGCKASD